MTEREWNEYQMNVSEQERRFAKSIPLIGIPVLNRGDLLKRCVRSIDYPVDRIVIINNGRDVTVDNALEVLTSARNHLHSAIEVVTPGGNLGVAASWNRFLKEKALYILIVNSDIEFMPGTLERMHNVACSQRDAAILRGRELALFALHAAASDRIGEFDENFYPAYFEDERLLLSVPSGRI